MSKLQLTLTDDQIKSIKLATINGDFKTISDYLLTCHVHRLSQSDDLDLNHNNKKKGSQV